MPQSDMMRSLISPTFRVQFVYRRILMKSKKLLDAIGRLVLQISFHI